MINCILAPREHYHQEDVSRRLDPARLIAAIEDASRHRYHGAMMPLRTQMTVANRTFLVMPCYDAARSALGMLGSTVSEVVAPRFSPLVFLDQY